MTTPIRILLADDHAVLRTGLAALLNARSDMTVVGEAADGAELLTLAEAAQPDVILLDLTMPRLGGLEALPLLRQRVPAARVLILTMHQDEGYLRRALKGGAVGYVLKKAADMELIAAIQAIMRGDMYVHPSMTRVLLEDITPERDNSARSDEADQWSTLSEREQEVLQLVALGHTSKEIADQLSVSAKTVDTYRARGMEKLGLRSRAALVRFALAKGLME
ncbi:MAG: response regulator transcription factor [Chloroflexi bacterium]|nr:response regulator transcription factor [Chloroflexota bacterium]